MDIKVLLVNPDKLAVQAPLVPREQWVHLVQLGKMENLADPADLVNVDCLALLATRVPLACLGCLE